MALPSLQRILLVEDEPDIQIIAKMTLEAVGGFSVEVCGSGIEAIQKAPDYQPQLILLDVMMPELDGPSTLKALRQLPEIAATPVIFMSAKVQPQEVTYYRELGAIGVIPKPFDPMKLSDEIIELWKEYHD